MTSSASLLRLLVAVPLINYSYRVDQPNSAFRSARGVFARHRLAASPCSSCRAAPSSTIGVCSSPSLVSSAVSARFVLAGISRREAPVDCTAGRVHLNSDDTKQNGEDGRVQLGARTSDPFCWTARAQAPARNATAYDRVAAAHCGAAQRLEQSAAAGARRILTALKFHEDHRGGDEAA